MDNQRKRKRKEPVTGAERQRKYRKKIKNDPEKDNETKKKDRERKKKKREEERKNAESDVKLKEELKEKKRIEMQTYRKRKKEKEQQESVVDTNRTNSGKKSQTKQKRRQSKNSYKEKKKTEEIKKKNAVIRTQKWRLKVQLKTVKDTEPQSSNLQEKQIFNNRMAENRALRKAKENLPETPEKRAELIRKIASSPNCSKHLQETFLTPEVKEQAMLGASFVTSMCTMVDETKTQNGKKEASKAKKNLQNVMAKTLENTKCKRKIEKKVGLRAKKVKLHSPWWKTTGRKMRKDCIRATHRREVTDFFLSGEVTKELPSRKDVSKKTNESKLIMTMPIKEAFNEYKRKYPNRKIGFTTFYKLKPKNIKKVSETNRRCCLCQICCNVALMVEAANKFEKENSQRKRQDLSKNVASDITLCDYTGYPKADCLNRKCDECSASKIKTYYEDLTAQNGDKNIDYNKWETITIKTKDGSEKRCVSCVSKSCTFAEFLSEFEQCINVLPSHLFRAKWQIKNIELCKKVLKPTEAIIVMDYAENYSCRYQNEIQSAFWETTQVTIHPMMLYYHQKPKDKDENGDENNDTQTDENNDKQTDENDKQIDENSQDLRKHSLIGISNDLKHDAHAVQLYRAAAQSILKKELPRLDKIYEWTDGCASQYKGKTSFADISFDEVKVQRNFFETSHGKNVCDGLGAVVKNSCHQAVISGKEIINNARSFYNHCEKKLTMDTPNSKREFVYLDRDIIQRERPDRTNVKPLLGTRKVHSLRNVGEPYLVQHKNLSCFCDGCLEDDQCQNLAYVDPWDEVSLKVVNKRAVTEKATRKNQKTVKKSKKKTDKLDSAKRTKTKKKKNEASSSVPHASGQTENASKNGSEISVDKYVKVRIHGKRSSQVFVAQVTKIDPDRNEAELSFMESKTLTGHGNLYLWPNDPAISWESIDSIEHVFPGIPELSRKSTNDRQLYTFASE